MSINVLQRFYELMRDAKMEHYRAGRPFATEGQTECDSGLRVLLSGKMAAKCDDTFLVTISMSWLFLIRILVHSIMFIQALCGAVRVCQFGRVEGKGESEPRHEGRGRGRR